MEDNYLDLTDDDFNILKKNFKKKRKKKEKKEKKRKKNIKKLSLTKKENIKSCKEGTFRVQF